MFPLVSVFAIGNRQMKSMNSKHELNQFQKYLWCKPYFHWIINKNSNFAKVKSMMRYLMLHYFGNKFHHDSEKKTDTLFSVGSFIECWAWSKISRKNIWMNFIYRKCGWSSFSLRALSRVECSTTNDKSLSVFCHITWNVISISSKEAVWSQWF